MTAVAFPGQGIQHVGMAENHNPIRIEYYTRASAVLGYDLLELCQIGPMEQLSNTRFAQVAIMVTCISHWAVLSQTTQPQLLLGHSLGEVTALVASGAISFEDGVQITAKRGELMDDYAGEGQMVAVLGLDLGTVEKIVEQAFGYGTVTIANYNSPGQFVLAGEPGSVDYASRQAQQRGARKVVKLQVNRPFHSPLMQKAADQFAIYLQGFSFSDPLIPVVSNINSGLITSKDQVKMELVNQITSSVQWIDNIQAIERMGIVRFIEVGPGNVLIGLTKRITKNMELVSYP
ncbi:MAG TPA: ACP S-malonyltransferase [Firmicutes bacterium]|nr:ACP S-malonyltransferase [Bacillota bacterium]